MPDTLLRIIEKLMDLAKGPVWVSSSILLILYAYKVNAFELYTLLSSSIVYPAVVLIVFIVSGAFFFNDLLSRSMKWLGKIYYKRKTMKASQDYLRFYLTLEQKETLQKLVHSPDFSDYIAYSEHIGELDSKDIISVSNIALTERYRVMEATKFRCTIKPWAFKYLKKHPQILKY